MGQERRIQKQVTTLDSLLLLQKWVGVSELESTQPDNDDKDGAVIVSIDFENTNALLEDEKDPRGQLGVAILDTRDLINASSRTELDIISRYNFSYGYRYSRQLNQCGVPSRMGRRFLFGRNTPIHFSEIKSRLEDLIPSLRTVILVGHSVGNELKVLKHLGFRLYAFSRIIDTQDIAAVVLPTQGGWGLKSLTKKLGCPARGFHCAGNDAFFTLRCLLILVAKSCDAVQVQDEIDQRLQRLAVLGSYFPLEGPEAVALMLQLSRKELKRMSKKMWNKMYSRRKHGSEERDVEREQRIREERAARRRREYEKAHPWQFSEETIPSVHPASSESWISCHLNEISDEMVTPARRSRYGWQPSHLDGLGDGSL